MSNEKYVFAFGDKLPWEVEIVMMIRGEAPGGSPLGSGESAIRKKVVNGITSSLISLWSKAFGAEYIQPRKSVQTNIRRLLQTYYNNVTTAAKRKKRKGDDIGKSKRQLVTEWRTRHDKLFCLLKKSVNVEEFKEEEKVFYKNQKSPLRSGYISDKVDEDYENEREHARREQEELEETLNYIDEGAKEVMEEEEPEAMELDEHPVMESEVNVSLNHSGLMRIFRRGETLQPTSSHKK